MSANGPDTATTPPQDNVVTRGETDELPPPSPSIERGAEVSRYLVLDTIGSGGMGRVFSAHDPELDRRVAIKVLYDGDNAPSSSGANELLREGRALASLRHPNIVSVYDIGWHHGELFIAMEYVEGKTLDVWLRKHDPSPTTVLEHFLQAGNALAAAHDAGFVHGDFKPANVMVEPSGRTVVLDFGLARSMTDPERLRESSLDGTLGGVGTPAYMAPEQHAFERATPWSDQFSFCVSLYEAFVGKRPFPQRSLVELTQAVLDGAWEDPGNAIPGWVWRHVERGLAVDPRDRHPDMHALLRALDPTRRRRRLFTVGAGLIGVSAVAAVGSMVAPADPCSEASAQLAGLWDSETQQTLDVAHAEVAAWPSVRSRLDGFASRWTAAWQETCEATHVHETQSAALLDRRMACLQSDRIAVAAAVDQLRRGDRSTVQRAAWLPVFDRDGRRCRTEALGRRLPLPPAGPQRERYEALLQVAAEQYAASALSNDPHAALAVLDGIEADEQTHPDVRGAIAHARAEAFLQLDQPKDAHAAWTRAAQAADAAGDDAAFVRYASILAFLDVQELDRVDAAQVWIERARSRAAGAELTHGERFALELRGAVVTRFAGDVQGSIAALEALQESEGPFANDDQQGTLHHNLGELFNEIGRRSDALEQFKLAIELRSAALGSDHRYVGQSRFLLSRVLIEEGLLDEAERETEAAAAIFANVEGGAPERVMAEESRAILHAMRGDLPRAEEQMRAVLTLADATLAPDDRRIATVLVNHGRMLMMLGKAEQAIAEVQRGLDLEEAALGPDHHALTDGLALLAQIELGLGHARKAQRLAERAASLETAPLTRLELRLAALICRAHAECDTVAARKEADALLNAGPADVSAADLEDARASVKSWDEAVAAYPACQPGD